jgi:hypothetical protein
VAVAPPVAAGPVVAAPPLPGLDDAPPVPGAVAAPPEPGAVTPPEPGAPGLEVSLLEQATTMTMAVNMATSEAGLAIAPDPTRGHATEVLEPAPLCEVGGTLFDAERCAEGPMV